MMAMIVNDDGLFFFYLVYIINAGMIKYEITTII